MTRCCVFRCGGMGNFAFPRDEKLRAVWIKAINREESWLPSKWSRVCEKHFWKKDLVKTGKYGIISMFLIE